MNLADVLLLLAVLVFALRGFSRGLARELLGIVGVIGGLLFAATVTPAISPLIESNVAMASPAVIGVTFVVLYALVNVTAGLVGLMLREPVSGPAAVLRSLGGAAIGGIKAAVVIGFVVFFVDVFRVSPRTGELVSTSLIVRPLVATSQGMLRMCGSGVRSGVPAAEHPRS